MPKGRSKQTANSLFSVVKEELSWPDVDPERPVANGSQSSDAFDCYKNTHATSVFRADQTEQHASKLVDVGKEHAISDKTNFGAYITLEA